jgi:acyl carrier protein
MTQTIINELAKYIASEMLRRPEREITNDEALLSSGLVDSFSLVDLALFIEDRYAIVLRDTELNVNTFDTLDQLAEIIQSRLDKPLP